MSALVTGVVALHNSIFLVFEKVFGTWFLGLLARLIFASVLLFFFWNSAYVKVIAQDWTQGGERIPTGIVDYLTVEDGAYNQISPKAFKEVEFDSSKLGVEHKVIAYAGTYAEFLLPLLVVLGLFTRVASLGMIVFIGVLTYVDATGHGVPIEVAKMFDNLADDVIVDQRLLWLFPLFYLVLRGPGAVSLDALFGRFR